MFRGENREFALEYFANSEKKLREVKRKANQGYKYYEKLAELAKKHTITESEIKKILKKIKKINNYMESDYMAETVVDSLKGLEAALRPLIYQTKEEQKSELADVAEHGKVMLFAVAAAAEEIGGIAHDTLVPYAKDHQTKKEAD